MGFAIAAVLLVGLLIALKVLDASGFLRALPLLLLLGGLSLAAHAIVRVNFDPAWARTAAIAAPLSILGWAAWRPAFSHRKLWVMARAEAFMLSVCWLALLGAALTLPLNGFHLEVWVRKGLPLVVLAALAFGFARLVQLVVVRSAGRDLRVFDGNLERADP